MGRIIPCWKQRRGCSARPQSHLFPKGQVLPSPPLQPAHTLTFWVRHAKSTGWSQAVLCQGRRVSLWGQVLSQLGGEHSVRGEKEAFAALPVLQQLLCQMHWWWARQLHWAGGSRQEELQGHWGCQHCPGQGYHGLQGLLAPVNLSGISPFLLHLEFPLAGGWGTQLQWQHRGLPENTHVFHGGLITMALNDL